MRAFVDANAAEILTEAFETTSSCELGFRFAADFLAPRAPVSTLQ
jgi:hypothetical protein